MRSPCTTTKSSPLSPQLEKARAQQLRPTAAKNKRKKKKEGTVLTLGIMIMGQKTDLKGNFREGVRHQESTRKCIHGWSQGTSYPKNHLGRRTLGERSCQSGSIFSWLWFNIKINMILFCASNWWYETYLLEIFKIYVFTLLHNHIYLNALICI